MDESTRVRHPGRVIKNESHSSDVGAVMAITHMDLFSSPAIGILDFPIIGYLLPVGAGLT